jgi:precorrin-8X/cobalt-precorrin-8 methylmutase
MKIEIVKPAEIETRSFEIIGEILGGRVLDPENEAVIKRCIHTSADFDYADNLHFSWGVTQRLSDALKQGADIVTDTMMARAGINKSKLGKYGGQVHCFMADEDVAKDAAERGVTRAAVCMEKACAIKKPVIIAVGNAPTALIRLKELIEEGRILPVGIIAAPVGFVNVVESKDQIMELEIPHIVARGRKGGSNIAAAICNALLYR